MDTTIFFIIGACLAFLLFRKFFGFKKSKLGIVGQLIWQDDGARTKPFFNGQFNIFGKPDLMYRRMGGVLAVEYKNRDGQIYLSDIIQAKAAALAARGSGYRVNIILVKTNSTKQYLTLPKKDFQLYSEISVYAEMAKRAKLGHKVEAKPEKRKCRCCAYVSSCKQKQL